MSLHINLQGAVMDFWTMKIGGGGITVGEIVTFVLIIAVTVVIARIIRVNTRRVMKERMPRNTLSNLEKLVYYGIISIGFVVALSSIGFSLSGLLVAGGI
ncbi:MAG: hypothetical protein ACP5FL_08155, partial [Thermoplasmatota archaeon]